LGFSVQNLQLPAGQTLTRETPPTVARVLLNPTGVAHNEAAVTGQSADGQTANATATHDLNISINTQPSPGGPPRPIDGVVNRRDDFTVIRGIGEARATTLQEAGVNTFGQLAGASIEKLHEIFPGVSEEVLRQWVADAKGLTQ
jgi:predicted flap endonuclease-1-like 5' DNA nuclease